MVATAFAGELLNINAFDQPGVEAGKTAARAALKG
jgi:glucose-6-phosphate isomerase